MNLKEIMSVSGQGGLFKFISQARNGIVVESFLNKKRSFVSVSTKVIALEDVAVYTEDTEVSLKEIFRNIHQLDSELAVPDAKSSSDELKEFMAKVLPGYDRNRVYVSDIKKIASWYAILKTHNLLDFEEETKDSDSDLDSDSDSDLDSDSKSSNQQVKK